jgi:anti-anti-sigma factor
MEQKNEIKIEKRDSLTVLDIKGDVTILSEPYLNEAYKTVQELQGAKILLNFDTNAYINSGGIALLIQLLAQARKNNQQVGITGLSAHFKKIFMMVGITKFAKIHDSLEEAVTAMNAGS